MKNSFEKSMEIYNKIAKNNFENSVIEFNSPKPTIRAIDPILQRPENAVESTMEKMIENTGNHIDYTTTSFYILEKLFNDNENVKQVCRTYANFASNCTPHFLFESQKQVRNKNLIEALTKLFKKPNRNESWLQLVRKTYLQLVLFGNSYWQIRFNKSNGIYGIYSVPAQSIRPIPYIDELTGDLRFVYCQLNSHDGLNYKVSKIFTDEELLHFKTDNPFSSVYGISEFAPLFKNITFDINKKTYLNNYLKNSYSGGMIFEIKDTDAELVERNRQELIEMLSGVDNAGRNMILEGNIRLVSDGNKAKDFPLTELGEINRDTIMTCAGVPLTMAGIRSEHGKLNAELVESEEQVFLRNIETLQSILFDTINNQFFSNILFLSDLEVKAGVNKHFSLKRAESMVETLLKVGCTVDEAREILGVSKMKDSEYGNMLIIGTNNGVIPLETFVQNLEIDQQKKQKELELMGTENNDTPNDSSSDTSTKPPSLVISPDNIEIQ